MTAVATTESAHLTAPTAVRRPYDSTLRRQRAAETRARIIAAGSELLHGSSVRDWRGLTIRAVADRAGVNERTVYRHFTNEQGLRDAVMRQFEDEAGIDLRGMQLEDVADVTARIFAHVSSYPPDAAPAARSDLAPCQATPARGTARRRFRTRTEPGPTKTAGWRRPSWTCCGAWPATSA